MQELCAVQMCIEYSLSDRTSILRTLVVRAASRVSCQGYACPTRLLCTFSFGATAAGAFLFVLRNSMGTWNVPNLLYRAKTPWS